MIKIDGAEISTPSSYQVTLQNIEKTERNASGGLIVEVITTKRKLDLGWNHLSQTGLATLLTAVANTFFSVEYPDPQDGALKTGTFKKEDRTAGAIDYQGGVMRWKDIKFTLVEK